MIKKAFFLFAVVLMAAPHAVLAEDYCADAQTTPEINECTREEYDAVAAKLDEAVTELRKMAVEIDGETEGDYKVATKLDASQTAFKAYAEASCEFAAAVYTTGTGATAALNACLTKLTQQRLDIITSELPR